MADFASKFPLAMPFTAKKKQKYHLFSPSVSCSRLRRVQNALKTEGLDGVLCILGIDGRYNSGTRSLLNYLLFGYCDLSAEKISARLTDETLEDLVVLIKLGSAHIYCNPANYNLLLPFIAHWRNLHIHCLAMDEDDDEKAEEFKILSFISMVKGCSKIGIPYGQDSTQLTFDPFVVEKWPLVQAFALEGFGGGGFFTMFHEVVDITSKLNEVLGVVDPVAVEILISERLPLFERHCKSILANVDIDSGPSGNLSKTTESLVGEPIISYYKHGHMANSGDNPGGDIDKPFVLFGVNTRMSSLDKAKRSTSIDNQNSTLAVCGVAETPAKHMVCYGRDPKGTISCIRTYFFGNGFVPYTDNSITNVSVTPSKDLRLLIDLYLLAIDALLGGITTFVHTQDIQQAKNAVDNCIRLGFTRKSLSLDPKNVIFTIEGRNFLGRHIGVESNAFVPCIKMASLYLFDIPSTEHPGTILGSVAFGETFLDSAVKLLNPDNGSLYNSQYIVITENVARYISWQAESEEKALSRQLEEFAKSNQENSGFLAKQLIPGDTCVIAGEVVYSKHEEGTLYVYEEGFLFVHARFGAVVLPLDGFNKMQFYDGESSSSAAVLILNYLPSMVQHLPPHLVNNHKRLVIVLLPRTKVFRLFYSDVLHAWKTRKDNRHPSLELVTELPDDLIEMYSYFEQYKAVPHIERGNTMQHAMLSFPQLKHFLSHIKISSTSTLPIAPQDIALLLDQSSITERESKDTEETSHLELLLTIVTGVPGSGKDELCNSLLALAKDNSKWIVLKRPFTHTQAFDAKVLQASLSNTVASQKKLMIRMSTGRKQVRVILVTPGFTDIVQVVQAIYSHPKPEVKNHMKIGAITCCVDPKNMFIEESYTLPKLLDQCAQGWVNNIVFTSCLEPQNEELPTVQKLIRACNPDAAFILAKGGKVTRSSDVDLILSDNAFTRTSAMQRRHLMCPGWSLGVFNAGPYEPDINEVCIYLFGPLDKNLFVAKLRALQDKMSLDNCMTSSTIYRIKGHVLFVDHNTITEVHWTALNGSLTMKTVDMSTIPRPPPKATQNGSIDQSISSYFVVFTGFSLKEDVLKDWLRTCCQPKPQRKALKGLKDLTKQEMESIAAKHKCDPLPEGWFYTGTTYVNLTGEKSNQHPLMDNFLQHYLTGLNDEITRHNTSISNLPEVDIFQSN